VKRDRGVVAQIVGWVDNVTPELTALTLAALLQVVQYVIFAIPANLELTPAYTSSPRDTPPPRPLSKVTARLQRALNNHFEALTFFTIAVHRPHRRLRLDLPRRPHPLHPGLRFRLGALAIRHLVCGLPRNYSYAAGDPDLTSAFTKGRQKEDAGKTPNLKGKDHGRV
jgi:hypothetical protein